MAGYVHVCVSCGAHLRVHERYFGRTLRCTRCRAEFVADPAGARVEEVKVESKQDRPERARRNRRRVLGALGCAAVAGIVFWLGLPKNEGPLASVMGRRLAAGRYGVARADAGAEVLVAIDGAIVKQLVGAAEENDAGLLRALAGKPAVLSLGAETRVRIIELRKSEGCAVVRVLDGPWEGRRVWIPLVWVH